MCPSHVPSIRRGLSLFLTTWTLLCAAAFGADASPDRGSKLAAMARPAGHGRIGTANPPTQWSEEKNIKWKVKIPGQGLSTPIVWGDKVFIQTAIPTGKKVEAEKKDEEKTDDAKSHRRGSRQESGKGLKARKGPAIGRAAAACGGCIRKSRQRFYQFVLMCLDRKTGETLWQKVAREEVPHEGYHAPGEGSFASGSPVTDGKQVFAFFGSRGLYCYDMDGNLKWEKDLGKMKIKLGFGEGSSPALYGNTLVVTWDHEGRTISSWPSMPTPGEELWRVPRKSETVWATPLVVEVDGQAASRRFRARKNLQLRFSSGKLMWECKGLTANPIPSPVAGDGLVYLATGYRGSALLAIKLDGKGEGILTGTEAIAWSYNKDTPYVPSPLLFDGRLYFTKVNTAMLTCLNAKTGEVVFGPERMEGLENMYASPVAAAGRIYLVGRNGTTVVVKAGGDKLKCWPPTNWTKPIDASPALVGNEMLLRGKENLYCIARK